jgi:tripartite-type tricarboxylate transporter receptor subunit TctC
VSPAIPATSVRQLVEYGKNNPGKLTYGSAGIGTSNHLHGVLFGQTAGVDVVHVPYKGSGPVITDMISGQIAMAFIPLTAVNQQVRSGKLRLLATLPAKRYPGTADIPAIGETLPGFEQMPSWMGFLGPPSLPRAMTARLNTEIVKAVNSADVRAKLDAAGFAIITNSPEEFAAQIKQSLDLYGRIVKTAGVQPE